MISQLQDYKKVEFVDSKEIAGFSRLDFKKRQEQSLKFLSKENPIIVSRAIFSLIRYLESLFIEQEKSFEELEQMILYGEDTSEGAGSNLSVMKSLWHLYIPSKFKEDLESLSADIAFLKEKETVSLWEEEEWAEEREKLEALLDRVEEYQSLLLEVIGKLGFLFVENFIRVCDEDHLQREVKSQIQSSALILDIVKRVRRNRGDWLELIYEADLHKKPSIGVGLFGTGLISQEPEVLYRSLKMQTAKTVYDWVQEIKMSPESRKQRLSLNSLRFMLERGGDISGIKRKRIQLNSIPGISSSVKQMIVDLLEEIILRSDDSFLVREAMLFYSRLEDVTRFQRDKVIIKYIEKSMNGIESAKLRAFLMIRFVSYLSLKDAILLKRTVRLILQEDVQNKDEIIFLLKGFRQSRLNSSQIKIIELIFNSPNRVFLHDVALVKKNISSSL